MGLTGFFHRLYLNSDHLIKPQHRHDSEKEKAADGARLKIRQAHDHSSFAPSRLGNIVKHHVDGHDYFHAISVALDAAQSCIFILDWWLSPELELRRPNQPEWRLDHLLKRKAEQGVKIYICVYKEMVQAMPISSHHTKHALEALHPNIQVVRHPDHTLESGLGDITLSFSHHEKLCVVDNGIAFMGGLDLCFGRWDTNEHRLADVHPTDLTKTVFMGQDYNNARIADFPNIKAATTTHPLKTEMARMPWHDVSISLTGPVVIDLAVHFVERWNFIRRAKHLKTYDLLAFPEPNGDYEWPKTQEHPLYEDFSKGKHFPCTFHDIMLPQSSGPKTKIQVLRSACDWSHGILPHEQSIQDCYIAQIGSAQHHIYMENQFFITSTQSIADKSGITNKVGQAIVERIIRAHKENTAFKMIVLIPSVPGFSGSLKSRGAKSTLAIMHYQYISISRGTHSIFGQLKAAGIANPSEYIQFYHLRSYDRVNASTLLLQRERILDLTYVDAQVAHTAHWLGPKFLHVRGRPKNVTLQTAEGQADLSANKANRKSKQAGTRRRLLKTRHVEGDAEQRERGRRRPPKTCEEAKYRFERWQRHQTTDAELQLSDNISHHAMRDGNLENTTWTPDDLASELDCIVTELLYIHSKIMIIDDRRIIVGSANMNERSQTGILDSEIAVLIEDEETFESQMNGETWQAGLFAASIRRKLMAEHLGLADAQPIEAYDLTDPRHVDMLPVPTPNSTIEPDLVDPLSTDVLKLWEDTAKTNTEIFSELFRVVPDDRVKSWADYKAFTPEKNIKIGHLATDLTIQEVKKKLSKIRGHLVNMPMDFLVNEDLTRWNINTTKFLRGIFL